MTISYKWLCNYLPVDVDPERLSLILTSIGLEVENVSDYEEYKGGLQGLVAGKVLTCEKHPNADKLKITTVNIGTAEPLEIVCGAPNVAVGQKVIVAPIGTIIHPVQGEPVTMKKAKIRGIESQGMICAEDEIGLGNSHEGIKILPDDVVPGTTIADYFGNYTDTIYEIGLTPNRMDAMSHWGVARDVCAYLSHHDQKEVYPKIDAAPNFQAPGGKNPIKVVIENTQACPRYSGISIHNVKIGASPQWLQQRLKSIGLRPINNIVDITNFILHETGQPLHAFDADKIKGNTIIVKNLPENTTFITLDEKERKLSSEDLMICDAEGGMCIGGVYGGLESGVTDQTKNIFLESAFFNPITIRKTSFRHGLRTDAATRFEKGTDISATVTVLKRAATLIQEICGGEIASDIVDIYPNAQPKTQITLSYNYLTRLSGKYYPAESVKQILLSLGFIIVDENHEQLQIAIPYHKPDISLPADVVEEILRIDGLDNVEIPSSITITPSIEEHYEADILKEKASTYLAGIGYNEILTNSITNRAYFTEQELQSVVKMKNSLSAELNIMRPNMLETGMVVIAHNLNRKNNHLKLFEFGKTYAIDNQGLFEEPEHLCIYVSGKKHEDSWKGKASDADFYTLKGVLQKLWELLGIQDITYNETTTSQYEYGLDLIHNGKTIGSAGLIGKKRLEQFDISQPLYYADVYWDIIKQIANYNPVFKPLSKFPAVERDIAMIVPTALRYNAIENTIRELHIKKLQSVRLFDIFKSERLGTDKKSVAISLTFLDEEKTLTDMEIEGWMHKIIQTLEKDLQAEIRKS